MFPVPVTGACGVERLVLHEPGVTVEWRMTYMTPDSSGLTR